MCVGGDVLCDPTLEPQTQDLRTLVPLSKATPLPHHPQSVLVHRADQIRS